MATYAPVQETLAAPAGPPIDPEVLDQRRKLAQALIAQAMGGEPIGSWTQGVANLAQALMGGYTVRKANQQEAAGRASGAADTAATLAEIAAMGGGGGATEPATTGSIPSGGGGGIGSDAVAGMTTEEAIVRTVAGEAAGEPAEGQAAVASVILNRAKKTGRSPKDVVLAKNQFEPWSRNPQRLMALTRDSPKYQQILANIQPALQGQDVTGGATHFYAPRAQAALGRDTPGWARGPYQDIGNHRFFKLAGGPLGPETAALPNVQPVAAAPSPDVMKFLGGGGQQPQPAGLSIGDGTVARIPQPRPEPPEVPTELPYDSGADPRTPQPRPALAQALALPPASGRGTVPLPPVHPLARQPQPRPTTPLDPVPAPAPATTGSIAAQPQPARQIFREPSSGAPLSAQEFARQGQNYLTGRGSFANQTPRVAPRTMQEPIAGAPVGAPAAAAAAQPRRGLLDALFGRGAPGQPAPAQAAPAGSPVAAAPAPGAAAPAGDSAVARLMANPYVSDAIKAAVFARALPKAKDPINVPAGGTVFDPNTNKPLYTAPEKPGDNYRPMTDAERPSYGIPADDKRGYQINTRTNEAKPTGGSGGLSLDLTGGTEKQIFETLGESAKLARSAVTGLQGIRDARKAIAGGIISGAGANLRLPLQKIGALLGVADPKIIENTETFTAAIAPQVGAMLHAIAGTTQISNADMKFAQAAAGGDISLDEASLKRLLDIMERGGNEAVRLHQKRLDSVYPADDAEAARSRALFTVDMPAEAPDEVTPASRPTATDPKTGKKVEWDGSAWVPVP